MFETTIEKDLQTTTSDAERESICSQIYNKFRGEFLQFIEELKQSNIANVLYNSSTPEESISIWETYSSENQDLFNRIRSWAKRRDEYFNTYESVQMFDDEEKIDFILEIGLIIFIVNDECILSDEDIYEGFEKQLFELLKKSSNEIIRAAGWYIDCNGFELMTRENVYDYYSEN